MSDIIINVENLSKRYLVGHQSARRESYTALRDVIAREARNLARKTVDLMRSRQIVQGDEVEEFWALRDVTFEVKQGEVFGIIGRNGAGKSTLLKILSRITEPDRGRAALRGRVASLLEVGTGFHPELTGRENIFLNGAILGMTRAEIVSKFDEIVAFAEVERFIDTPVKRYSSGMYVRLAFSIAAHLEPEILIVDEILAVGDVEFQRRCLGKIEKVAHGGRTVLFVSHNMASIKSLASRCIVLDSGRAIFDGATAKAIESYVSLNIEQGSERLAASWGRGVHTVLRGARLVDDGGLQTSQYTTDNRFLLQVELETDGAPGLSLEAFLVGATSYKIGIGSIHQFHGRYLPTTAGVYRCTLDFGNLLLASGAYSIDLATSIVNVEWDHRVDAAVRFEVPFSNPSGLSWNFSQSYGYGALALLVKKDITFEPLHAIPEM